MKRRILHTMIRVGNLDRSMAFYAGVLGMSVLRTFENPAQCYTLVFMGFGAEEDSAVIELTYNHGVSSYTRGEGFGHIGIGVECCYEMCEQIKRDGGKIIREPGKLKGGDEIIAFTEDPDGNRVEIIERSDNWFC